MSSNSNRRRVPHFSPFSSPNHSPAATPSSVPPTSPRAIWVDTPVQAEEHVALAANGQGTNTQAALAEANELVTILKKTIDMNKEGGTRFQELIRQSEALLTQASESKRQLEEAIKTYNRLNRETMEAADQEAQSALSNDLALALATRRDYGTGMYQAIDPDEYEESDSDSDDQTQCLFCLGNYEEYGIMTEHVDGLVHKPTFRCMEEYGWHHGIAPPPRAQHAQGAANQAHALAPRQGRNRPEAEWAALGEQRERARTERQGPCVVCSVEHEPCNNMPSSSRRNDQDMASCPNCNQRHDAWPGNAPPPPCYRCTEAQDTRRGHTSTSTSAHPTQLLRVSHRAGSLPPPEIFCSRSRIDTVQEASSRYELPYKLNEVLIPRTPKWTDPHGNAISAEEAEELADMTGAAVWQGVKFALTAPPTSYEQEPKQVAIYAAVNPIGVVTTMSAKYIFTDKPHITSFSPGHRFLKEYNDAIRATWKSGGQSRHFAPTLLSVKVDYKRLEGAALDPNEPEPSPLSPGHCFPESQSVACGHVDEESCAMHRLAQEAILEWGRLREEELEASRTAPALAPAKRSKPSTSSMDN